MTLSLLTMLSLASCHPTASSSSEGTNPGTPDKPAEPSQTQSVADAKVLAAVKDAMTLSRDELMKKAAQELGNNQVRVYAVTSRGGKSAALNKFKEELKKAGSTNENPVVYKSTVDGKIYTILNGTIEAKNQDYDGAILQDGYQLQKKFIDTGYYTNYIPKEWADDANSDKSAKDPFTLQYNFKTIMYNNKGLPDMKIDNVWDMVAPKYKGKLFTMDPSNENVNMDWLITLTDSKWAGVLKKAYEDPTNDQKANLPLTEYESYGDLKYSYAFIANFLNNAVFSADDGKAVDDLAKTPGAVGWIVYSKIMNIKETDAISKKNIVIAALGNENTDGANPGDSKIKGFGGFMYKHYMSIMPNAKYPYATCAFFNILSTTKEGYTNWATDVGDYPTMPSINKDRTKGGHGTLTASDSGYTFTQSNDAENVFPCLNDPSSAWWNDSAKGNAVIEDPAFIGKAYNRVASFIQIRLANKK
jgi:hypothetical protein